MSEKDFNWAEYGRVEKNEIKVSTTLTQKEGETWASTFFENVSKRDLNLYKFQINSQFDVFMDGKKMESLSPSASVSPNKNLFVPIAAGKKYEHKTNFTTEYGIPKNFHGELRVRYQEYGALETKARF